MTLNEIRTAKPIAKCNLNVGNLTSFEVASKHGKAEFIDGYNYRNFYSIKDKRYSYFITSTGKIFIPATKCIFIIA